MADLIDRQALLKWFDSWHDHDEFCVGYITGIIGEQPPVDAVEVVRCRDCIWRYHDVIDGEENEWCGVWANRTQEDAFCSYGKGRR